MQVYNNRRPLHYYQIGVKHEYMLVMNMWATSSAANDVTFVKMTAYPFQCNEALTTEAQRMFNAWWWIWLSLRYNRGKAEHCDDTNFAPILSDMIPGDHFTNMG